MPSSAILLILAGVVAVMVLPRLVTLLAPKLFKGSVSSRVLLELEGSRRARHSDVDLLRLFHDRPRAASSDDVLDDRTCDDLDLDQVFSTLDFAVSEPGRQYLYASLRSPRHSVHELDQFERQVQLCAEDSDTPSRIRAALSRLGDRRAAFLVHLIYGDLPVRPAFWWVFPLLTATSLACLAVMAIWPRALLVWVPVCVLNIAAQLIYKPRVKRFIPAIHELPNFLNAAASVGELAAPAIAAETGILRSGAKDLRGLRRASRWLMFEPEQSNELVSTLYEYVNLLFLFDVNAFLFAIGRIRRERKPLGKMFEALGAIDMAQSTARWRTGLAEWATPTFTVPQKALDVDGVAHPLLEAPVRNGLVIDDSGVLISGSNMSGKTTFIRALGINAVLAQTLHTVCASRWHAPLLRVRTFIGRADSIAEGKSYYLAEAEAVLGLIRAKESGAQHLFLLDEIFRGTNTTERIAAASAVLAYLDRGNDIVVVATHDLEVLELLGGSYAAHHFTEQIDDGGLSFDYRIRPGPSSTRNAIALLQYMKYPDDVIADALANIEWHARAGQHDARS